MEEGRSALNVLTINPTGKSPRCRWKDNIRMDLEVIGVNARN